MARRQTEELRAMDIEELDTRLAEAKQELFNLRFQLATGQLDNSARIRQVKKQVARLNTVIREKELAAYEAARAGVDDG
jgi:large subunit ribosomal protein L29